MKWIAVNGLVLFVFAYDLWGKCAGYTSVLHYVELVVAGVAGANLLQHAVALAHAHRLRRAGAAAASREPLSPRQRQMLARDRSAADETAAEALSLSLSMSMSAGRAWRSSSSPPRSPPSAPHSPHSSPHSPHSPHAVHSPSTPSSPLSRYERDEFIADRHSLANYLSKGPAGGAGGGSPHAHVWRRLQLDPQRLTQFNQNLRLWLQVTILERLVREMDAVNDALAAHGLSEVRIGQVSTERLRKMAAGGFPALGALLPFLEPFPDQSYVVQRYRELASGGCLSAYKWNGGGAGWDESKPTDAELVLHAFAAYLDAQLPPDAPQAAAAFSARHVSAAPAAAPRGPQALALHRVARSPPHYVLVRGDETIEVGAGRNNLLHCLLLFVAVCAAREPPALQRLHLGRAGLNLLWVVGR
ncbi:hypothetical protein ABMA27_006361 [Loxostege sticticalis]|uniref:Transmembrane protein 209 n=1 Tax=Loxostege sticticalis TaxID=481309 RepID=A0ABR3HII9_LOXSC